MAEQSQSFLCFPFWLPQWAGWGFAGTNSGYSMPYNIMLSHEKHGKGSWLILSGRFHWTFGLACYDLEMVVATSVGVTGCVFVPIQLHCKSSFSVNKVTFGRGNSEHPFPDPCKQDPVLQCSDVFSRGIFIQNFRCEHVSHSSASHNKIIEC